MSTHATTATHSLLIASSDEVRTQGTSGAMLTTQVIRNFDGLAQYAADLDSLFADTEAPIAARWGVIAIWLLHHRDAEPLAVLVWSDGTLAAAALMVVWHEFGYLRLTKIGEFGEPACLSARSQESAEALAAAMINALADLRLPWSLNLTDLPVADTVVATLCTHLAIGKLENGPASPLLRFDRTAGLNAYLTHNTRSAVAKAINRVTREGLHLEMRWTSDAAEVERNLPEILEVHRGRNRQRRNVAILDDPAAAALFKEIVLTHARSGRLRLLTLRLNGALAAFMIGLLDRGMLWVYANLVSPDWVRYSAGTIANAETVRMAYADPSITGVNWGTGIQRYKMSGAVTLSPSVLLSAWSSHWMRVASAARAKLREIKALFLLRTRHPFSRPPPHHITH